LTIRPKDKGTYTPVLAVIPALTKVILMGLIPPLMKVPLVVLIHSDMVFIKGTRLMDNPIIQHISIKGRHRIIPSATRRQEIDFENIELYDLRVAYYTEQNKSQF